MGKAITLRVLVGGLVILAVMTACGGGGGGGTVTGGSNGGPAATYTVGGRLEGLVAGNQVALQNNGGDDLVLVSNGSFSFPTGLGDGDTYQVTVATDAADCHCTVENGSGTVAGADVTSVLVKCRHWAHPADLGDSINPDGETAFPFPRVAMADNGDALITWAQKNGDIFNNVSQLFKSEFRNGTWHHPADLADNISPNLEDLVYPSAGVVAMADGGEAIIAWSQEDMAGEDRVFLAEYRNGSWRLPTGLSDNISPAGQDASYPLVAMNAVGDALVAWQQSDGFNEQIFLAQFRDGTWNYPAGLFDNISPNNQDAGSAGYAVAMDSAGDAIVVWTQHDGSLFNNTQVFKSEFRNGTWSHPAGLGDNISPDLRNAKLPQVAMADNGEAIIVWVQQDSGATWQVFKSEYRNGTWHHPADLSDNISPDGQDAEYPMVAMGDNGDAVIVWRQKDGGGTYFQVFKSEFRNGAWSHPADLDDNISPDGTHAAPYPDVALDGNGEVVIVWAQHDGNNMQVFKSEFRNGTWRHPADLDDNISPDGQDVWIVQVAADSHGNALIAWSQEDGNYIRIFKSEYR